MASRTKLSLLATALATVLSVGSSVGSIVGCKSDRGEAFELRVISIDAHGGPALPEDRVRAIVRRALARSPSFAPAQRDQRSGKHGDTLVATFEYRELPDASDHGRDLMVRMNVEAPRELARELGPAGLDVTVLLERAAGEAQLDRDLQLATDRLVTVLQARTDLAAVVPGTVDRLLRSGDIDLLILTLEWVRDHPRRPQARAAADRVAELIRHEHEEVGLLAIDAIGQIGGPEHVPAVLDGIQLADTPLVNRAYDALARLGGPEAEGFLKFAVRNEDEPTRREAAERALRRVAESDIIRPSGPGSRLPNRGHR